MNNGKHTKSNNGVATGEPAVIINLVALKNDVDAEEFARFSVEVDRPIWLAQDVVRKFEVFQVADGSPDRGPVQFVEIIEVSSLEEWHEASEESDVGREMAAAFGSLADGDAVRTMITNQI